jgi:hypothetical protein
MDMSGQLHASAALPPGKELLVARTVLDAVVKRKIPNPFGNRTLLQLNDVSENSTS